jgi:hypothetical protein
MRREWCGGGVGYSFIYMRDDRSYYSPQGQHMGRGYIKGRGGVMDRDRGTQRITL